MSQIDEELELTEEVNIEDEEIDSEIEAHHEGGKVTSVDLSSEMRKSFLSYAMSVIVARAIPDVRDGLKPVHRRILFGMNELSVYPNVPHKKSARIVGEVMGKFHPHGDTAIYDSMVRMAQDFSYRYPLVDGHGNFGSIDSDGAAAMRYTEARMSKAAMELLRDLEKNTVNFVDNYDGTEREPEVLPSRFPNLLVNGASGIAVGMATNIPPHNMGEVIDAILALMKNPEISIEGLMNYIKGPDFPTGGLIMGLSQIRKAYLMGEGTIAIRAKTEINELKNGKKEIIVTEIPYQINKKRILERIAEVVKDKTIDGITDLRDESNMKGIRIVIELRRDANANVILNNLYKHTQLQSTFGINMLALDKGQPKVMNLKQMLTCYLNHQITVITRRTEFELEKARARAHILEGLLVALSDIDAVVALLKRSRSAEDAQNGLMRAFKLTEIQAKAILDMKLQRLTSLEIDKIKEEYAEKQRIIKECNEILKSPEKKNKIIANELTEIKAKYGDPRRTEISMTEDLEIEDADLIPEEDIIITVTSKGYAKRLNVDTYRAQNRGGKGVSGAKIQDEDCIEKVLYSSTHDTLLFFSNFGMVYKLKAFQIPPFSRASKGLPLVNLLNFSDGEKLAAILSMDENIEEGYFTFCTKRGLIKRTEINEFNNIRANGIKAILLNEDDELLNVAYTDGEKDIIIAADSGKGIRFSETDVRPMGRISAGVRGLQLTGNAQVIGMAIASTDGDEVIFVTNKGYGKRTFVDSFRVQTRGGVGVKSINLNEKNGHLICLSALKGDEDLMIITDKGMVIRTHLDQITTVGRDAQGVKLMTIADDQTVTNIAIVPRGGDEEEVDDENLSEDIDIDLDYQFIDEEE